VRMTTFLILAGLVAGPISATEVISFEEFPPQNSIFPPLSEEYAHLGVHFSSFDDGSTWAGMSDGDFGGWGLEGTNGPTFAGFNGDNDRLTARFDAPVPAFSLDVAAARGGDPAGSFALEGYRSGALVERSAVTFGAENQWMTVALTKEVDQVVVVGDASGYHPFGIDNLRWGVDAPTRLDVAIDVRPGNAENPVNPGSNGMLPVALLGSTGFDVMDVDPESLALGVNGAPAVDWTYADANDDGAMDLVAHYSTPDTGTAYGDTSMCLTGATQDGVELAGCDAIRTVPQESAAAAKKKGKR
jgi:hypothetical protein